MADPQSRSINNFKLREYRAGDWEAMHALDVLCFEPAFRFSRGAMRAFAETPVAITVLAESDDELAGFCIAHVERQAGYIVTLDVATAWRRRHLAQQLMAEIESRVRRTGSTGMTLHVYAGNAGAVQFYEAIGYARLDLARGFYGRGRDALIYAKSL